MKRSIEHTPSEFYGSPALYIDAHYPWTLRETFQEGEEIDNALAGRLELYNPFDFTADYIRPDAAGRNIPVQAFYTASTNTEDAATSYPGENTGTDTSGQQTQHTVAEPIASVLPSMPNLNAQTVGAIATAGIGAVIVALLMKRFV